MSYNERPSLRQTVLPAVSFRTLQHPSFLPLYMLSGSSPCLQEVCPITPAELFYSDPSGMRVHNTLTGIMVFNSSRLDTPRPIMSACPAPPSRPDPFRSGPYLTRDLGSPTWSIQSSHSQTQPRRVVLQLTQEEDQAVTNLLKLHHQAPPEINDTSLSSPESFTSSSVEGHNTICSELNLGRGWTETELEVADALLSGFNRKDEDLLRPQPKTLAAVLSSDSTENGPTWSEDERDKTLQRFSNSETSFGSKDRMLTNSEADAVCVVGLGDEATVDAS